jgi:transcriptional regulator with XRE-family HTH domain
MGTPPSDPVALQKDLRKFGKRLDEHLTAHDFIQSDLARVTGLDKRVVSRMVAGDSERLTPLNFLRWLKGIILLGILPDPSNKDRGLKDQVEDWLADFYTARHETYKSLKEHRLQQAEELIALIEEQAKANLEKALETQKLRTDDGISFIGRRDEIRAILKELTKTDTQLFTLTGIPGVGKTELALQIAKLAEQYGYFSVVRSIFFSQGDTPSDTVIKKIRELYYPPETGQANKIE